jgi:GTPase SAR1 family protein
MVLFNYSTREVTAKIVYYGPGLCGKTTNLKFIYESLPSNSRSKMISLATNQDRTLFFDFLPLELGTIKNMNVRLQLYTVPGQVFYNSTRQLVLKGADGVIFVADSQDFMEDANIESWNNLKENLLAHGIILKNFPHIIQYNKRDLPNILPVEHLNSQINEYNVPYFEAIATTGYNVEATLKEMTKIVLQDLIKKYNIPQQDAILSDEIILIPQDVPKKATITVGGSIMGIEDETLNSLWEKEEEKETFSFEGEEYEFKEIKQEEKPLIEKEPFQDIFEKKEEKGYLTETPLEEKEIIFEKPLKEKEEELEIKADEKILPIEKEIFEKKEVITEQPFIERELILERNSVEEPLPLSVEKIEKQLNIPKETKRKEVNLTVHLSKEEIEDIENLELNIKIKIKLD